MAVFPGVGFAAIGVVVVACLAGCQSPPESGPTVEAPVDPAVSPAPEESASLWGPDVEGIAASASRFASSEACVETLRRETPVAVVEGLDDLRYDGFFEDTCRSLEAVRQGRVEACDALEVSTARAGCRRRLAIVHGRPEVCPRTRLRGPREATCVAWASRDPSLCAAALSPDRVACRAMFEGEQACRSLPAAERARCGARVARFSDGVEAVSRGPRRRTPRFELEVQATGEAPQIVDADFLASGVALSPQGCRWRIDMLDPAQPSVGVGVTRAFGSLVLALPADAHPGSRLSFDPTHLDGHALLTMVLPSRGGVTSMAGAEGEVVLEAFEAVRGASLCGRVRGRLRSGRDRLAVEGRFCSFVRDLDPLPPECGAAEEAR